MEMALFDVLKEIMKLESGLERMRVGKANAGLDPIILAELLKIAGNLTTVPSIKLKEDVELAKVASRDLPAIISWAGVVSPNTTHCRPNSSSLTPLSLANISTPGS